MNWSKIKSIMIVFLAVINVFLIIFMAITTHHENYIPQSVVDSAAQVLTENGFACSGDIIPDMYKTVPRLNADFYSASELSDIFFGKQLAFRTEKDTLIAEADNAKLSVNSNYFCYETDYSGVKASPKALSKALAKAGIDMKNSVYDSKNDYFYLFYKNVNLFNMYLRAKIDEDGELCYVEAQWPKISPSSYKKRISFIESVSSLPDKFKKHGKITSIEFGYSLVASQGEKYIFRPSWRVKAGKETEIL